jgi:hypothetical protein
MPPRYAPARMPVKQTAGSLATTPQQAPQLATVSCLPPSAPTVQFPNRTANRSPRLWIVRTGFAGQSRSASTLTHRGPGSAL